METDFYLQDVYIEDKNCYMLYQTNSFTEQYIGYFKIGDLSSFKKKRIEKSAIQSVDVAIYSKDYLIYKDIENESYAFMKIEF